MLLSRDALELIQQTAQEAQRPVVIPELNSDGRRAYVQQCGRINSFELPPAPRQHVVHDLEDLIAYALRPENPRPVVWHGDSGVVLLVDDADRRDQVVIPLTHSTRFDTLAQLDAAPKPMNQQQFVRLLRRQLGLDPTLVNRFRRLDWKAGTDGRSEIERQNVRVAKSIVAEVQGIDELPEEITVPVPVYAETGMREEYLVQCYVEIDPTNQLFGFGPMPDELQQIVDLAQAAIRKRLEQPLNRAESPIPIYYGRP